MPQAAGGAGFDQGQVHELISQFVEPIGGAFLLLLAGVLVVDLGYLMAYRKAVTP